MKYHLSDYELNAKDPDAIVYRDAYGNITRLTRADFSSEEEFQKWKAISDDDLHERHKGDLVEMKHTVSVGLLSESSMIAVPGPEQMMFEEMEADEYRQRVLEIMNILSGVLSKIQFRRLWMYVVDGLPQKEIAKKERTAQQQVSKSIKLGIRAAKKYFCGTAKMGCKMVDLFQYSEEIFSNLHES